MPIVPDAVPPGLLVANAALPERPDEHAGAYRDCGKKGYFEGRQHNLEQLA